MIFGLDTHTGVPMCSHMYTPNTHKYITTKQVTMYELNFAFKNKQGWTIRREKALSWVSLIHTEGDFYYRKTKGIEI